MRKKLDTMFTLGLGKLIYTVEFIKDPYKCYEKLGSLEDTNNRVLKAMEIKYAEE